MVEWNPSGCLAAAIRAAGASALARAFVHALLDGLRRVVTVRGWDAGGGPWGMHECRVSKHGFFLLEAWFFFLEGWFIFIVFYGVLARRMVFGARSMVFPEFF